MIDFYNKKYSTAVGYIECPLCKGDKIVWVKTSFYEFLYTTCPRCLGIGIVPEVYGWNESIFNPAYREPERFKLRGNIINYE